MYVTALQRHALAEAVDNFKGNLRHVLREIDYRYYGVNNKASRSSRDQSASDLIAMIEVSADNSSGVMVSMSVFLVSVCVCVRVRVRVRACASKGGREG